jgi:hypothetical protein
MSNPCKASTRDACAKAGGCDSDEVSGVSARHIGRLRSQGEEKDSQ